MNGTRWMGLLWLGASGCATGPSDTDRAVPGDEGPGGTPWSDAGPTSSGDPNVVPQQGPWTDFDKAVAVGVLCGITVDGAIDCPLADLRRIDLPDGVFTDVRITGGAGLAGCGLEASGELACFDAIAGSRVVTETPEGRFIAVAGHSFTYAHACGVGEDGHAVCWGEGIESDPPDDVFGPELSGWNNTWCGLLEDQTLSCWETSGAGSAEVIDGAPEGAWDSVVVGDDYACAMRGTSVTCWGDIPGDDPPDESLLSVGPGESNICGVRPDQTGVCWGTNGWGQLAVPEGEFTKILPGREQVCGLRVSGIVECWGLQM